MRRFVVLFALAACPPPPPATHWNPVAYRAHAQSVDDAAEQFQHLMLTGRELSPIRVDVNRDYAILYFYQGDAGMLHFGEVASAKLLRAVEMNAFDVQLVDAYDRPLYRYTAKTEQRAHAFIDAVSTLSAGAARPPRR